MDDGQPRRIVKDWEIRGDAAWAFSHFRYAEHLPGRGDDEELHRQPIAGVPRPLEGEAPRLPIAHAGQVADHAAASGARGLRKEKRSRWRASAEEEADDGDRWLPPDPPFLEGVSRLGSEI